MTKKRAAGRRQKINVGRLFKELCVIAGVGVAISLPTFIPWALSQPIPWKNPEPYHKYKDLLIRVQKFDYDKGDRARLEKDLGVARENMSVGTLRYFFNLQAVALYEETTGNHRGAMATLEGALGYAPTDRQKAEVYEALVRNARAIGDEAKAKRYSELLSDLKKKEEQTCEECHNYAH